MIWKLLSSTLTVSCLILMHINSLQNMKRMINNKSGSPTHLLHNKKNYLKTRTPILLELKSLDQKKTTGATDADLFADIDKMVDKQKEVRGSYEINEDVCSVHGAKQS